MDRTAEPARASSPRKKLPLHLHRVMILLGLSLSTGCVCFRPPTDQEQFARAEELKKEGVEAPNGKGISCLGELIGFLASML